MVNMETVSIFGVSFANKTIEEIAAILKDRIGAAQLESEAGAQSGRQRPFVVFTPNPEIVLAAQEDKQLFSALQKSDINSADGIGVVWASKYFGNAIKKRASGYDIVQRLFKVCTEDGELSAFFLGGKEEAVTEAAAKMETEYKGLKIPATRNGYFADGETPEIINKINESNVDLLLVGLGSPKQEMWVTSNAEKLDVSVIIVVGGSFDVMSGRLKRAPVIFQKLGLEWFYRLITQPSRIKRMMKLPLFVIKVLFGRQNGLNKTKG